VMEPQIESQQTPRKKKVDVNVGIGPTVVIGPQSYTIPCELLDKTVAKCTALATNVLRNEHNTGCSILRSVVAIILTFEANFKRALQEATGQEGNSNSVPSRNESASDNSITSNFSFSSISKVSNNKNTSNSGNYDNFPSPLHKCYEELKSACQGSNDVLGSSPHSIISWMVVDTQEQINTHMLFSLCVKIVGDLVYKQKPFYFTKNSTQPEELYKYWKTRHQQAQLILLPNNSLRLLLDKVHIEDAFVKQEISCFQKSVELLVEAFLQSTFPSKEKILQIYSSSEVKFNLYMIPELKGIPTPEITSTETDTPRANTAPTNKGSNKSNNKGSSSWFGS